jgi:hypothetical protein
VAVGISEKSTDSTDNILRNPHMSEESKNNLMVAAIKRLGEIIEEKVVVAPFTFITEKSLVIVEDVILHDPTRDIAGLAGVNNVGEGENDKSVNGRSNQAIVCIRDDNRSGVLHRTQAFFGEKVEQAPIKVFRRSGSTIANTSSTTENDWARDINQFPVDGEGDAIGPRGGVVRLKNNLFYKLQVERTEGRMSMFVVV